jgi:hypothetical protein
MAAEEFVDSTIAALKVIGMVPKSGKLCVRKGQLSLDLADKAQPVRRWADGDSRDVSLMHARNSIGSAIKISKSIMASSAAPSSDATAPSSAAQMTAMSLWTLDRMSAEMEQCEVGLQNLKTTYATDSMMVANLDVLADRLKAHKTEVVAFLSRKTPQSGSKAPGTQQQHKQPTTSSS